MKPNDLDMNKLKVFCSVVRHGGYAGASRELHLSRSAISQAISKFEESLELKLFNRVGTRIIVTPKAQNFYKDAIQYQAQIEKSMHVLAERSPIEIGVLRA